MKEKRTFLLWFTLCVDFIEIQAVNFGPTPQKLSFKTNGTRAMSKPNNSIVSDQGKGNVFVMFDHEQSVVIPANS